MKPTPEERKLIQAVMQSAKAEVSRDIVYRHLMRRRFEKVKGYAAWEDIAALMILAIETGRNTPHQEWDFTTRTSVPILVEHVLSDPPAPLYWVSPNLLEALMQTDISEEIAIDQLEIVIKNAVFVFPRGAILTPDGESMDFLLARQFDDGEGFAPLAYKNLTFGLTNVDGKKIGARGKTTIWSSITSTGIAYGGHINIDSEQKRLIRGKQHLPEEYSDDEREQEKVFVQDTVHTLILKLLLFLHMRPDFVEPGSLLQSGCKPGQKLGKAKQFDQLWSPNWIGRTYQPRIDRGSGTGTHASPRMHWRRGHSKRVLVGPREKGQRKWVWIEPTLVAAQGE